MIRHKEIWLQVDEPEITWCQDKVHRSDVKYLLASAVRERIEALEIHPEIRVARADGNPDGTNFPEKILLERNGKYCEFVQAEEQSNDN